MPAGIGTYLWFARRYQWTPDQVDDLDLEYTDWLMLIESASDDAHRLMDKPKPGSRPGTGAQGFGR